MRWMKRTAVGLSVCLILLCTLMGAFLFTIKVTGIRLCTVEGHSMDDTLFDGEQLLINPSAEPRFGDIVVFEYHGMYLIKRILGMPGDTVTVTNGTLYVNGVRYEEPYLEPSYTEAFQDVSFTAEVDENSYFVMGDNRDRSQDSRQFGCIAKDSVTGVAIWHF